jgi:hypothetical protein
MRALAAGFLAAAVVVAAATASSAPTALVLRLTDLPTGFTVQRTHTHASPADAARDGGTPVAQLRRWGFRRSYLVQFAGQPGHMFTGPVTVVSAAAVFRTAAGARAANAAARAEDAGIGVEPLRVPAALGREAWGYTYTETRSEGTVRVYAVSWRRGSVQAYLAVNGIVGVVAPKQLFTLAAKQDRHLTRPG